MRQYKIE